MHTEFTDQPKRLGADSMTCQHSKTEIDRPNKVYRCSDCGAVVGHFAVYQHEPIAMPLGMVSIGNGLYARTKQHNKKGK
jgi:hypothetical protein